MQGIEWCIRICRARILCGLSDAYQLTRRQHTFDRDSRAAVKACITKGSLILASRSIDCTVICTPGSTSIILSRIPELQGSCVYQCVHSLGGPKLTDLVDQSSHQGGHHPLLASHSIRPLR